MYPNQPNFGEQNNAGPGGAQGDFGSFGMNGGVGGPGANPGMGYGANPGMNPGANPGMGYGMEPNTNPGGDVVFTSAGIPEKKNKKKFIIIGAVVGVLVIVLVVLSLVFSSGGSGGLFSGGAPAGFNELREFIEKGDAETRALFEDEDGEESSDEEDAEGDSEESEYIMAIRISEQSEAEVRKYYAKLAKLEQDFYKKSVDKVDAGLLSEYENALKVLKNAINYYEAKEGLIAAYENGGESGAFEYYKENIECDEENDNFLGLCFKEMNYYSVIIEDHAYYSQAGCYLNGIYNLDCARDYYGSLDYLLRQNEKDESYVFMAQMREGFYLELLNSEILRVNSIVEGER